MKLYKVDVVKTMEISESHLDDLITTAFYGAYPWWHACDEVNTPAGWGGWTIVGDNDDDKGDATITKFISREKMARQLAQYFVDNLTPEEIEDEDVMGYIDLDAADSIVQRAFYGDVIFG